MLVIQYRQLVAAERLHMLLMSNVEHRAAAIHNVLWSFALDNVCLWARTITLTLMTDRDIWHAGSSWPQVKFKGQGHRLKFTVTRWKCSFFCYACTLHVSYGCTALRDVFLVVCRIICAKVIGATSSKGFPPRHAEMGTVFVDVMTSLPGAAPWWVTLSIGILASPFSPIMGKHDVIHKTGSRPKSRIALSSEEDRATATGNMYNFMKFGNVNIRYSCRQAYRHTYRNISHPPGTN